METTVKFIDSLLIRYRVTLKMVYDCNANEKEAIADIKSIFDLGTPRDFRLCLVALRILGGNNAEKVAEYFKSDRGILYDADDQFFDENKTLVLTAFMYNPAFFAMAVNLHGLIDHKLQKQKLPVMETVKNLPHIFDFIPKPALQFEYLAASGAGRKMKQIGKPAAVELNGISGELRIDGSKEMNNAVQFVFLFSKYHRQVPFYLDVSFVTKADKLTHKARICKKHESSDKKKLAITSPVQYEIDFSKGIAVTEIRGVEID